jgi:predicted Zn-dependent peptidase
LILGALILAAAAVTVSAQNVDKISYPKLNKLSIPDIEKVTLPNGLRIYIVEDHRLPIFRASVRLNFGSYLEPADKIGLADVTGEVLRTGGTQKWTGDELDEALEGIGGSVETSIGLLSGSASVNVLSEYTDLGLDVLSQILRHPTFDEDKLDLAKVGQRSGISRRNDDPQGIAFREFTNVIYGKESVYARDPEYATINSISRDDLVAFHGQWCHPENVQIAVWGDLDKNEIVEKIKTYFGDWPNGGTQVPPAPEVDYQWDRKVYYAEKTDVNQSNILIGHIGGMVKDEDYADRIVMNSVFGGGFGSRMFNNIRSKEGLAYATFGSYTANITHPGLFIAFTSTKSETTGKAVKEMVKQIEGMQSDPPTAEEMRRGKDGYLNSFVFNFDTKAEVVNRMMNYDYYGLPEDFLNQEKEKVEKVTPEDVVAAAKRNLHPDQLKVLVVGKGADFEIPLDQLDMGTVDTLDISIPSGEEKKELAITPDNIKKGTELLAMAAEAHGGVAAFKAVKSMSSQGKLIVVTPNGDFPVTFQTVDVFPNKSYSLVEMMGNKMYDIWAGSVGWKMVGPGTVGDKTEDDLASDAKDRRRNTIMLLANADNPENRPVYAGTDKFDGKQAEIVVIVDEADNEICRLAIDPTAHTLIGKSYWGSGMMGGEGTISEIFENVEAVGGVMLPKRTVRLIDGQKMATIEVVDWSVNGTVAPELFSKPQ